MADVKYTNEQLQVIETRNSNLLVSAAAGSGKTAVLTERIVSLITDAVQPVDIDRMLIVTFTNAAAAEMRERIGKAIEKRLEKTPEDYNLQRQSTLLHNAQITTIDSFCLFVIRNNFGDIGLDPGFRILDEGERKLLLKEVLDDLLERHYEDKEDAEFRHFVECYTGVGKESEMEKQLILLHEAVMSGPEPEQWLSDAGSAYDCQTPEDFERTDWWKLTEHIRRIWIEEALAKVREGYLLCQESDGPAAYATTLLDYQNLTEELQQEKSYDRCYRLLHNSEVAPLSRAKGKNENPDKRERCKYLRDEVKGILERLKSTFYPEPLEHLLEDNRYIKRTAEECILLVRELMEGFAEIKRERNVIDFADMEHFALQILTQKGENGERVPTKTAREYQDYFEAVMVDEYQDSNYVQEYILRSVAKENNYFMVGDVKQSIYKFRQARPEIFIDKYYRYTKEPNIRIDLNKNFRSRKEVLDSVNDIFGQIMKKETAGMEYDDKAKLYLGADYEPAENGINDTEIMLLVKPDAAEAMELDASDSSHAPEAMMVAGTIRKLISEKFPVRDKESGIMRPVRYGDIVILLRATTGIDEVYKRQLEQQHIPVYTTEKSGYFKTVEVKCVLNFLKVLDNPGQDVPFYGVMTSFFGGFTEEEAAGIRAESDERLLYDALCNYKGEKYAEKAQRLLERIREYRERMVYTGVRVLLEQILQETGYLEYITAFPGGEKRRANLLMLLEKATAFESTSYHGLFHFVRYISQLKEQEVDYGEAGMLDENADVVRIMTIHKSKGLEFPVCFVCGMGKRINVRETGNMILSDAKMGIGLDYINPYTREKRKGFGKKLMAARMVADSIAEEMRVLYVALTRAKEKLFITATVKDEEAVRKELPAPGKYSGERVLQAGKYLDLILPPIASAGKWEHYVTFYEAGDLKEDFVEQEMRILSAEEVLVQGHYEVDEAMIFELKEKFAFSYPYVQLANLYTKTTVSELKSKSFEEEAGHLMFEETAATEYIPAFAREAKEGTAGTRRGSAYHRVMELFPYAKWKDIIGSHTEHDVAQLQKAVRDMMEENRKNGRLSWEYAELVDAEKCVKFLQTDLAKRMAAADSSNKLYKEKSFFIARPASEIEDQLPEDENILIQGVIDVYFEENGKLVVADYKTDRVKDGQELIERYQTQLDIYGDALTQLTGLEIAQKLIYSFALNEVIVL